ncbi:39S ribosomal protein L1, mitochondrial [Protopterus annectens]|uniref:39S ribosomal protein L1, mitochondrial n=1 Tax=Protopterus annectens TaxID=7888 RepID=UPI001CFBB07E|nr:39S ribosomal protein L1, mitochondrial [Protopterus annectens]
MAALIPQFKQVLGRCHSLVLNNSGQRSTWTSYMLRKQYYASEGTASKRFTSQQKKKKGDKTKAEKAVNDTGKSNPYGLISSKPVDDVYVTRFYPKPIYDVATAVDLLKRYQQLDFTDHNQAVYLDLKLDMNLEKKKKVEPFVNTVCLPYPFKAEKNKVLMFTENTEEAKVAEKHGAVFVGGSELIEKILEDEIQADFYVAVPEMLPKLLPLKNKLRKKFPKSKRGSVGRDIPKMIEHFKNSHEYMVERECYVFSQIATLDMPQEQIIANMSSVIKDVFSHKPASTDSSLERAFMCSATSESLWIKLEYFLSPTQTVASAAAQ